MPTTDHIGVSRRIEDEKERARLREIVSAGRGKASGGFIVRTVCEGVSKREILAAYLQRTPYGGNVEGVVAGETVVRHGVQLIGAANLPASVPLHASQMFATNVRTLIAHLTADDKSLRIDATDEIAGPMMITSAGEPVKR